MTRAKSPSGSSYAALGSLQAHHFRPQPRLCTSVPKTPRGTRVYPPRGRRELANAANSVHKAMSETQTRACQRMSRGVPSCGITRTDIAKQMFRPTSALRCTSSTPPTRSAPLCRAVAQSNDTTSHVHLLHLPKRGEIPWRPLTPLDAVMRPHSPSVPRQSSSPPSHSPPQSPRAISLVVVQIGDIREEIDALVKMADQAMAAFDMSTPLAQSLRAQALRELEVLADVEKNLVAKGGGIVADDDAAWCRLKNLRYSVAEALHLLQDALPACTMQGVVAVQDQAAVRHSMPHTSPHCEEDGFSFGASMASGSTSQIQRSPNKNLQCAKSVAQGITPEPIDQKNHGVPMTCCGSVVSLVQTTASRAATNIHSESSDSLSQTTELPSTHQRHQVMVEQAESFEPLGSLALVQTDLPGQWLPETPSLTAGPSHPEQRLLVPSRMTTVNGTSDLFLDGMQAVWARATPWAEELGTDLHTTSRNTKETHTFGPQTDSDAMLTQDTESASSSSANSMHLSLDTLPSKVGGGLPTESLQRPTELDANLRGVVAEVRNTLERFKQSRQQPSDSDIFNDARDEWPNAPLNTPRPSISLCI